MSITQTGWYYGPFEFHDDEVAAQNWNYVVHAFVAELDWSDYQEMSEAGCTIPLTMMHLW